jgi:hypothetical protein
MKAGALLVAAGFTKGFAFLLLPIFVRRYGPRFAWYSAAALIVLGLPIWVCLPSFMHGMKQYLGTVHVNSGLFHFIYTGFRMVLPGYAYVITSRLSNVAVLAVTCWSVRGAIRNDTEMIRRAIIVIGACLLVVPTLFPWYVLWLLPLVLIYKPKPSGAFIALSGSVALMYLYYCDYTILWWFRVIEYAPFYFLFWREHKEGYWLRLDGTTPGEGGSGARTDVLGGASESVRVGVAEGWVDPAAAK